MKKCHVLYGMRLLLLLLLVNFCFHCDMVEAASQRSGLFFYPGYFTVRLGADCKAGGNASVTVGVYNYSESPCTATISSSDTKVAQPAKENSSIIIPGNTWDYYKFSCKILKEGTTMLTFHVGGEETKIPLFVFGSDGISVKDVTQTDYKTMKITWKPNKTYDGYYILRSEKDKYDYQIIKTVAGSDKSSAEITCTDWNKSYTYVVQGYMQNGSVTLEDRNDASFDFMMKKQGASITGIKKSGTSSLKIQWNKEPDAVGYKLYRANSEHGKYKCIYTAKNKNTVSYTQKVSKGVAYYYKVKTIYPKFTSDDSKVVSKMLPKSASVTKKTLSLSKTFYTGSQYSWNWASSDSAYYYTVSGKLYMVVPDKNCIRIYTLNSSLKKTKSKKIKIKYDNFGGFYHGPDGNFYVAVGYNNPKENNKKTVIKVIKYNKKWKKEKTCSIKGSASNSFIGIYIPFDAGSCRMDMQGTTLYMHTCREMYAVDNVHHQSNISFAIDTKTMKGKATGDVYVSHSFNQYVKFDNGNLYLLDHGDAYPRNISMTMIKDYGTVGETNTSVNLFSFKGNTGDNFTGCTVGGMEIGEQNVLVCGTSQPHNYKIKGVSGMKSGYAQNAYLIVADKETGKSTVKWLTKNNPKKTKTQVGETRMVKLDDNRFAIMYMTQANKKKIKLHYLVVDGKGKKVYEKTYTDMILNGGTQPIVYKGRVVWADYDFSSGKNKIYAVPALLK